MSTQEKNLLQRYLGGNCLGCWIDSQSLRYKSIKSLELGGYLQFVNAAEGFIYHRITEKGKDSLSPKSLAA